MSGCAGGLSSPQSFAGAIASLPISSGDQTALPAPEKRARVSEPGPQAVAAASTRDDGQPSQGQAQPAAGQLQQYPAASDRGPAFWAAAWNPPTPPPPHPGARRRLEKYCRCYQALPVDMPWEEAIERGWPCPIWISTPNVHPPSGIVLQQYSRFAQPRCPTWLWHEIGSLATLRAVKLLRCTCIPIWAALDGSQRTRRQLAAHAFAQRNKPKHLRTEEDCDTEDDECVTWPYLCAEDWPDSD